MIMIKVKDSVRLVVDIAGFHITAALVNNELQ